MHDQRSTSCMVRIAAVALALGFLASLVSAQTTLYVDDDACPGAGTGTVGDPYCSIQTAIVAAVNGDTVEVAVGTYFESIDFLGKAITVRSAFPLDWGTVMNTIIDGTGFFHVVQCVTGEGPDTVLSDFVITGGNANGTVGFDYWGGGMFNLGSSPTVTNCSFSGNAANTSGGGMFNDTSNPTVTNTGFCDNTPDAINGAYTDGGGNSLLYCPPTTPLPPSCPADFTGVSDEPDGTVDVLDLIDLLAAWGACP